MSVSAGLCAVSCIRTPLSQMLQYFFTLSKVLSQRYYNTIDLFSLGQQMGLSWSQLKQALSNMGAVSVILQKPPQ